MSPAQQKPHYTIHEPRTVRGCNELATLFYRNGNAFQAKRLWKKAIAMDPDQFSLHNNMGVSLMSEKQFVAAEEAFKKELSIYPLYQQAYSNLARLYARQNKWDKAVRHWKYLLAINPNDKSTYKILAQYYQKTKDYQKDNHILNSD